MALLVDGKVRDAVFVESPPSNVGGLGGKQRLIKECTVCQCEERTISARLAA